MTAEEILKKEYFKLPNASEEDWEEARVIDMHEAILKAMEAYAAVAGDSDLVVKYAGEEIARLRAKENFLENFIKEYKELCNPEK